MVGTSAAAARIGMKPKTLDEWRRTHRSPIPYYKIGNRIRYRVADLDEYRDQQRVPKQLLLNIDKE